MKTLKIIGFLFLIFNFNAGICQVDLFMDDDEDSNDEPQEVNQDPFMGNITSMLKQGEASPIGNWAGETLEIMTNARFADAPQEYLMAYQVSTKVYKVKAFNAALKKLNLSCEERKQVIQSYILFLGTLYLDMYSMDYFNEKKEYTSNEAINILIGSGDAYIKFIYDKYDRSLLGLEEFEYGCLNDITDPNVTDCNFRFDRISNTNPKEMRENLGMDLIHPVEVSKLLVDLQTMLDGLPCNK